MGGRSYEARVWRARLIQVGKTWGPLLLAVLLVVQVVGGLLVSLWLPLLAVVAGILDIVFMDRLGYNSARFRTLLEYPDPGIVQQYKAVYLLGGLVWIALGLNGLIFHYPICVNGKCF